jgi:hypothetical protein
MDHPVLCVKGRIVGVIKDKATGDVALGATVVATSASMTGEQVVISDEHGAYAIDVPDGVFTLTVYYNDLTFSRSNVLVAGSREAVINITVDSSLAKHYDEPYDPGYNRSPEISSVPRFGLSLPERNAPIARDRTHRAWIAPVAGADPVTSVTTIDGAPRLARRSPPRPAAAARPS